MTTLNLQVGASAGDSHQQNGTNDAGRAVTTSGTCSITASILSPGSHGGNDEYTVAARFTGVTVANAATINSANFRMTAQGTYNAGANVVRFWVSAQAADNAGALTATSGDLRTAIRARTTAAVAWTQTSVVASTQYSIDITTVIQEIVNRAGWVSGNAIVVIVDTHADCVLGEWQDYHAYDGSAGNAPRLDIDYTAGGGGGTKSPPFRQQKKQVRLRKRWY